MLCLKAHRKSYRVKDNMFQFPVAFSDGTTASSTCFGEDVLISWWVVSLRFFIFWAFLVFPFKIFLLLRFRTFFCFFLLWLPRLCFFILERKIIKKQGIYQLQEAPEPTKNSIMFSSLGRTLCEFWVNINAQRSLPAPAALRLRLEEKWWSSVENKAVGLTTKRRNCFAFSPLFSFSFELSQFSHLM